MTLGNRLPRLCLLRSRDTCPANREEIESPPVYLLSCILLLECVSCLGVLGLERWALGGPALRGRLWFAGVACVAMAGRGAHLQTICGTRDDYRRRLLDGPGYCVYIMCVRLIDGPTNRRVGHGKQADRQKALHPVDRWSVWRVVGSSWRVSAVQSNPGARAGVCLMQVETAPAVRW